MLRLFVLAAQVPIVLLAVYNAVVALWGWRNAAATPRGSRSRLVRIVVPAHNEEAVVSALVADLRAQDYPPDRYNVVVVADRCDDATASAVVKPARAVERLEGDGGKGSALAWYLEREPMDAEEVLVILDADNRVGSSFVSLIVDEFEAGATVVQCYLDVANPGASPLATASALSYWASNRMVQLARSNLGWSCDLGGTGMAFTGAALSDAGGFTDDLVEDQALGIRLSLTGHVVRWLHEVRIFDEKPSQTGVAVTQRARWMAGKRVVARSMATTVFDAAIRTRSFALGDVGIRMVQPSRTFLALVAAILGIAAMASGSSWLLPWWIWVVVVTIVFVMPIAFLWRDHVPAKYLIQYPLLVILAILWLPIRIASSLVRGRWKPTPHSGRET
ncbi:MAG: glycosyltransferase family 2 protein [Actinomycetia bacterium]|nr:glycosyltransferase family 2 protein [Actinomycetes bacterium]